MNQTMNRLINRENVLRRDKVQVEMSTRRIMKKGFTRKKARSMIKQALDNAMTGKQEK